MQFSLRQWQTQALDRYLADLAAGRTDWLAEATPGAGKTTFAGAAANQLLTSGAVSGLVVVVPNVNLKRQWAGSLSARFGIEVEPDWGNDVGSWPTDMHGLVVTYQQVAANSLLFRKHTSDRRLLVILDEVHHCNDDARWGSALRDAFEHASARLLLSGTPFRSDNNAIPFVSYVDGRGTPDFTYGYDEALTDGVCRPVFFSRQGGEMEWAGLDGQIRRATFDDALVDTDARHRLRTALEPSGQWLRQTLEHANGRVMSMRESDPDAAAIVFARDQFHARSIADLLRDITGAAPAVAISDDPDASEVIDRFATSSDPWIVSVKMVSEGVDIPRLRCGVFATNTLTEMFFRQAVGRVVRVELDADDDQTAVFYIPDDAELRRFAANIGNQVDSFLQAESERLLGELDEDRQPPLSLFAAISSRAEDRGVIVGGDEVDPALLAAARQVKRDNPSLRAVPDEQVALILRASGTAPLSAAALLDGDPVVRTRSQRKRELRAAGTNKLRAFAERFDHDHKDVNGAMARAMGATVKEATVEQLERRLQLAQRWLETGTMTPEPALR